MLRVHSARYWFKPVAQPHAAGDLGQIELFFDEAVIAKRLDGFEIALAQAQQRGHALGDVGGLHALRYRESGIENRLDLGGLKTLANQAKPGVRGEFQGVRLLDFKAWHDQSGESGKCNILLCNQGLDQLLHELEHGFRYVAILFLSALYHHQRFLEKDRNLYWS